MHRLARWLPLTLVLACGRSPTVETAAPIASHAPSAVASPSAPPPASRPKLPNGAIARLDAGPPEKWVARHVAVWDDGTVVLVTHGSARLWHLGASTPDEIVRSSPHLAAIDDSGSRLALASEPGKDEHLEVLDLRRGAPLMTKDGRSHDDLAWIGDRLFLGWHRSEAKSPVAIDLAGRAETLSTIAYNATFLGASADGATIVVERSGPMSHWIDFVESGHGTTTDLFLHADAAVVSGRLVLFPSTQTASDPDDPPRRWIDAYDLDAHQQRDVPSLVRDLGSAAAARAKGFAIGYADGRVALVDAKLEIATTLRGDATIEALDVSPQGTCVAALQANGTIWIWPL